MSPPAYLLVFAEPGSGVPDDIFNDWYDNEHIPLRVATPTFSSWVRYQALDGQAPRYGAAYDLASFEDTRRPPYTTLAETRSEREKGIFANSELFDRRIYDLYEKHPVQPPSSLYDPKKAAPVTVFRGIDVKESAEEELTRWYLEEHVPMLSKAPGWIRTRWFVLRESGYVGVEAAKQTKKPPKFLAVHEWADANFESSPEFKLSLESPWKDRLMKDITGGERRVFKLYKQWQREE